MTRHSTYGLRAAAFVVLALCGAPLRAAEEPPSADVLEALVARWVDLRTQIADEQRRHAAGQTRLQEDLRLLETEKTALAKALADAAEAEAPRTRARAEWTDRRQTADQAVGAIEPDVAAAEAFLRDWRRRIPPALAPEVDSAFARLPATSEAAQSLSVSRRLQVVLAAFAQLETLQSRIHVVRELLSTGSAERREMDVLYLGLARGFAVSPDGQWAATGTPSADGWRWNARPELAGRIREAVGIAQREAPVALVRLPLQAAAQAASPANGGDTPP